jgi:hypothetical protein
MSMATSDYLEFLEHKRLTVAPVGLASFCFRWEGL